jgi:hypothetical protein
MFDDWSPELYASKTATNTQRGFEQLIAWVKKLIDPGIPVRYVMEATGFTTSGWLIIWMSGR